jgi:hypothetical protein
MVLPQPSHTLLASIRQTDTQGLRFRFFFIGGSV